jgi:hypothetical protein
MMPRGRLLDALGLVALKLAIGVWALHAGFTHLSDDDYARTVIAEAFAHAPRLDPSGTSWLPLPFWIEGLTMTLAGRSLGVARGVALVLGAASIVAPYLAMRRVGMPRAPALLATVVAMAMPYGAWLGVATVPEGWAGALTAAALFAMTQPKAWPWAALALLAASLSRYEAWPACAAFAAGCLANRVLTIRRASSGGDEASARRESPWRAVGWGAVALFGPAAWMAWNAHAHGSATHFVTRVVTFRHAIGAADIPLSDKILGYPHALVVALPEAALLGVVGAIGLLVDPALRRRWGWPCASAAAIFAFLVAGDLGDGAPTHHPERALVAAAWIAIATGVDALFAAAAPWVASPRRAWVLAAAAMTGAAWAGSVAWRLSNPPGNGDAERRDAQIARGLDLRARDVAAATIAPCAFEQFALLAAWGAPERAVVRPRSGEPVSPACPRVEEGPATRE